MEKDDEKWIYQTSDSSFSNSNKHVSGTYGSGSVSPNQNLGMSIHMTINGPIQTVGTLRP